MGGKIKLPAPKNKENSIRPVKKICFFDTVFIVFPPFSFLQMNEKGGKTMNTVSKKHIFFTGLMLFSLFFGAGFHLRFAQAWEGKLNYLPQKIKKIA
jgi:hypothetical protein